ncbi:hypothetical protein BH23ACT3_BH23ACT3_09960 [soil metagenome]
MTSETGLLSKESTGFVTPGLRRFTRAHATAAAADAFVTVSLAGSLFFSVSPDASRRQVLTYLIVAMAPFVVLAPLIGPAIDRFRRGHRWIAVVLYVIRAALSLALAFFLFSLFFYVLALGLLVGSKASSVLKSALVPGLVTDTQHLVSANSRLARITTIVGGIGGASAACLAGLTNSNITLIGGTVLFLVSAAIASRLPRPRSAEEMDEGDPHPELEFADTHRPLIIASATAYTVIRFAVGAFVFGLAFALRRASEPAWMYGAALIGYGVGAYAGNVVAPIARRRFGEDRLLAGALVGLAVCAAFAAAGGSRILVVFVASMMGMATTFGRQGFDSLVQRHAPRALHGRSFSRFETQFQLGWVVGAAFATAAAFSTRVSLAIVAAVLVPASLLYVRSAHEARKFSFVEPPDDVDAAVTRHLAAAEHWCHGGRPRLAAVELIAAADLAVAAGGTVADDLQVELQRCRVAALDPTRDLDELRLGQLIEQITSAVSDITDPDSGPDTDSESETDSEHDPRTAPADEPSPAPDRLR